MAIIAYKKTRFREPQPLTPEAYTHLKKKLATDPDFKVSTDKETFTGHFSRSINIFKWTLPFFFLIVGVFVYLKGTAGLSLALSRILIGSGMLLGVVLVVVVAGMLLEGTSYATFLDARKKYFTALQYTVKKSKDYPDFIHLLYGDSRRAARNVNSLATEARAIEKLPLTMEAILVGIFKTIDQLTWIVGLILIGWLIKHYFFDK